MLAGAEKAALATAGGAAVLMGDFTIKSTLTLSVKTLAAHYLPDDKTASINDWLFNFDGFKFANSNACKRRQGGLFN